MSDFFTRLAEKALVAAPQVRPVIAPTFSPEPGVSGSFIEATGWAETDLPRLSADASGTPYQATSPDLLGQEHPGKPLPTTQAASEPSSSVPTHPATLLSTPPATQKPERVRSHIEQRQVTEGQPTIPRLAVTDQSSPVLDTPTTPDRLDGQVILVPVPIRGEKMDDSAIKSLETEAEFQLSPDLQPYQRSEPQTIIQPVITPTRRRGVSFTPRTEKFLEAQEEAGIESHLTPTSNAVETPVEPTIRVTIGRVDVRLAQSPVTTKTPPTRTASPPALSLDEYLKKRSEGRQ